MTPSAKGRAMLLDVNVTGTVEVLEWARSLKESASFLYVSTGSVYGNKVLRRMHRCLSMDMSIQARFMEFPSIVQSSLLDVMVSYLSCR